MTHIFNLADDDDLTEKISLDDLYEKKRQSDLVTVNIYNKILTRIHTRIKLTSRTSKNSQFTTFVVPEKKSKNKPPLKSVNFNSS